MTSAWTESAEKARAAEISFDVDQDDDDVAEDVLEEIHGGTVVLTPECTDSLEFAFSHFEMGFQDVTTLLGPVVIALTPKLIPGGTERDGIFPLSLLFLVGGFLLSRVRIEQGIQAAQSFDS